MKQVWAVGNWYSLPPMPMTKLMSLRPVIGALSVGQVFDVFATDGLAFSVENDVKIRFICLHEFPDIVEELILQHLLFI